MGRSSRAKPASISAARVSRAEPASAAIGCVSLCQADLSDPSTKRCRAKLPQTRSPPPQPLLSNGQPPRRRHPHLAPDSFPAADVATASIVTAAIAAATDASHRLRKLALHRRPPPPSGQQPLPPTSPADHHRSQPDLAESRRGHC
ncbi:hypothetical protein OsI_14663 [Oryza sativa Indica Group]|uniref:Uncharacterized protein n=1 Tax=Oryza sativa subsp. indica TaxID=39946 RepID=B8AUK4_ORYSI|nr:hypothetical protein OsI_14663 [Oryza sativa Indica Group]